jgi:hypothetical protein
LSHEYRIDEFTTELKTFIDCMRQLDTSVVDDLRQTIEDLNSSLYFFNKFNELWSTLKIQDRSLSRDSSTRLRN